MPRLFRDPRQQLEAAVEQIEDNAVRFRAGRNSAYQTVAVQLRKLLLKGRRALLLQVFPSATFHQFAPIEATNPGEDGLIPIVILGRVRFGGMAAGQTPYYELDVDEDPPIMPVTAWLREWVVRPDSVLPNGHRIKGFIIGELINDAANEEGAHFDRKYGPTLARMDGHVEAYGVVTRQEHEMAVVAIGEYVARRIRELLAAAAPDSLVSAT